MESAGMNSVFIVSITEENSDDRVQRCISLESAKALAEKWSRDLNAEVDVSRVVSTCIRKTEWRDRNGDGS